MRLEAVPDPLPGPREVLVRTLDIGICGTDRAIEAGEYGVAPLDAEALIIGHEVVGVVERPGGGFERGTLVAATVRRPCGKCSNCAGGEMDACTTGLFAERGILSLDGFAGELFVERPKNLVTIPSALHRLGVLTEPMSICERSLRHAYAVGHRQGWQPRRAIVLGIGAIGMLTVYLLRLAGVETWAMGRRASTSERAQLVHEAGARYVATTDVSLSELASEIGGPDLIMEAAGDADLVAEALAALGTNGVLCLRGIDLETRPLSLPSTIFTTDFVLRNQAVLGSTNAAPGDWHRGVADLQAISRRWPDALSRIVGLRVKPDRFGDALAFQGVKATIAFS